MCRTVELSQDHTGSLSISITFVKSQEITNMTVILSYPYIEKIKMKFITRILVKEFGKLEKL